MTQKTIIYEKIPEFDEATQCVIQESPIESETEIYYGIRIVSLEQQDYVEEQHEYNPLPIAPEPAQTIEQRIEEIDGEVNTLAEVVSGILGA